MSARRIEMRIGELVLEGVRPADAVRIGASMELGLQRLLLERGVPAGAGWERDAATPVHIQARSGQPAEALGAQLAEAIYGRLSP